MYDINIYTHTHTHTHIGLLVLTVTFFRFILQIASYSVSPNYDIIFFTSAIEHIANIVDYYTGQVHQTLEIILENLDNFKIKSKLDQ